MADKITLRQLREQAGLSRAEVAKALGVTVQSIFRYESGARRLAIDFVFPLAALYGEAAEDIIKAAVASIKIGTAD